MSFIQDLLTTLLYDCLLILACLGLGWISLRILSMKFTESEKPFFLVWLGWALTLILLQIINIFSPIVMFWSILLYLAGLIPLYFYLRNNARDILPLLKSPLWLGLIALTAILIAILSMHAPKAYDSGLYHFSSIRWLNEYPIVLGLGNLHSRLAFNQSFFVFVADLNLFPVFNNGNHIAVGFLIFLLLSEELLYLSKHIMDGRERKNLSASHMLAIFMIPATIYLAVYSELSAPAPDTASSILQILLFIYFVRALDDPTHSENKDSQMALVFILAATAITIKISSLVFVLTICIILLAFRMKRWRSSPKEAISKTSKILLAPVFIIVVWCLRGILLSGCIVFPLTFGCIKASWTVPPDVIQNTANWIYSWARMPRELPSPVLGSWNWFSPWFKSVILANKLLVIYPLVISLLGFITILLVYFHDSDSKKKDSYLFLIPAPIITGLIFWFFTAPDIRFVQSLFFLLPASIAIMLIKFIDSKQRLKYSMVIAVFFIININVVLAVFQNGNPVTEYPIHGYMATKTVRLISNTTLSGLEVFSPKKDDQCWDSILPCTPEFREKLEFYDNVIFPEFRLPTEK